MSVTIEKTYYYGVTTGHVVCMNCCGYTLEYRINADPGRSSYDGISDVFHVLPQDEIVEMREEFGAVCNCE